MCVCVCVCGFCTLDYEDDYLLTILRIYFCCLFLESAITLKSRKAFKNLHYTVLVELILDISQSCESILWEQSCTYITCDTNDKSNGNIHIPSEISACHSQSIIWALIVIG